MSFKIKSYRKSIFRLFLSTLFVSLIFTIYYSSYKIVEKYISGISENVIITAVVKEDVPDDSLATTVKEIRKYYWVKNVRLIKPEKGLSKTDSSMGGIPGDLLPENPLPALIIVTIKEDYLNKFNLAKYNLLLKRIDIVGSTMQRKDYADTVFLIKSQFSVLSILIGVLLVLIVLLIIFLSINPEFIKSEHSIAITTEIEEYNRTAKEIFELVSSVASISIVVSSGIIYLLWYLFVGNLPWFEGTSWQILLWNLAFVIFTFELVNLVLFLTYKPKRGVITKDELQITNEAESEVEVKTKDELQITNESESEVEVITNVELLITNEAENEVEELTIEKSQLTIDKQGEERQGDSLIQNSESPVVNKEEENWEDDIT
ncbi:MAG: hypothetical protein EPN82_00090 [Bacteroidetes bacterium]|nr:MAG: hypothetical protein EPN82_00090 [Bacteroidota bacterium]